MVAVAVAAFAGCWAGLKFIAGVDAGQALGWAVVPFSVALTAGVAWTERTRRNNKKSVGGTGSSKKIRVVQKQRAKDDAQQLQVGRDVRIERKDV